MIASATAGPSKAAELAIRHKLALFDYGFKKDGDELIILLPFWSRVRMDLRFGQPLNAVVFYPIGRFGVIALVLLTIVARYALLGAAVSGDLQLTFTTALLPDLLLVAAAVLTVLHIFQTIVVESCLTRVYLVLTELSQTAAAD